MFVDVKNINMEELNTHFSTIGTTKDAGKSFDDKSVNYFSLSSNQSMSYKDEILSNARRHGMNIVCAFPSIPDIIKTNKETPKMILSYASCKLLLENG